MVAVAKKSYVAPQSYMRLVRDDEPVGQNVHERRMFPRRAVSLTISGRRLDHTIAARREPTIMLNLKDVSVGGLSALIEKPLMPGERISVSFPREGLKMGWNACGRVIRCEAGALGYRIAVEFEALPSAA